jgi:heat shock protein HslJ
MPRRFLTRILPGSLCSGVLLALACASASIPPLSELDGVAWRLTELPGGVAVPDALAVTLAFEGERVVGFAGCNRYFGGVAPGHTAGELTIGPIGSTRMMCPPEQMDVEGQFLTSLQHVEAYRLEGDALWLTSRRAGVASRLTFARAREDESR